MCVCTWTLYLKIIYLHSKMYFSNKGFYSNLLITRLYWSYPGHVRM